MNAHEQASLDVLHERLNNLIARFEESEGERKVDAHEMMSKLDESLSVGQRLSIRVDKLENSVSDHAAMDEVMHEKISKHLDDHKHDDARDLGRRDTLAWVDKLVLRYLIPFATAGVAVYVYLTSH